MAYEGTYIVYMLMVFNIILHSNLYAPHREVIVVAKTSNNKIRNVTGWL